MLYDTKKLGGVSSMRSAGLLHAVHPVAQSVRRLMSDSADIYRDWSHQLAAKGLDSTLQVVEMRDHQRKGTGEYLQVLTLSPPLMLARLADELRQMPHLRIACGCGSLALEHQNEGFVVSAGGKRSNFAHLVLCNGVWAGQLGLSLGLTIPMQPVRGAVALWRSDKPLAHGHLDASTYLFSRKAQEGYEIVCGGVFEDSAMVPLVTPEHLASLLDFARRTEPDFTGGEPDAAWSGLRPKANPDATPLVGNARDFFPEAPFGNLWLNIGHHSLGTTCAPASARVVSELLFCRGA